MTSSEDFMRDWPIPMPERMAEIRKRVHQLAGQSAMFSESQVMLVDLYRGYSEAVLLVARLLETLQPELTTNEETPT
jgi:hypothetical protein